MDLLDEYRSARRAEEVARVRRAVALRAMSIGGMTQRQIAEALGVSQPAVSQQLKSVDLQWIHPEVLLEAAAPVLKLVAEREGFHDLAVFGSVARHEARADSDIDLLVRAPESTSSFGFVRFKGLLEQLLGRTIDLVDVGGLRPGIDDDIRREAVCL